MSGRVIINGRFSEIIETNRAYADQYWAERARLTGFKIRIEWSVS